MPKNVILLSSIITTSRPGAPGDMYSVTQFNPAGEPHADALVTAVAADYHRVTARPRPSRDELLTRSGDTVTLLTLERGIFGATSLQASEGTLFLADHGRLGLLPRGARTHGRAIETDRVLDLELGYGTVGLLQERVDHVRAALPDLEPLTGEHLSALPVEAPDPAPIGLVVFGTWRVPGTASAGAIWLLHSYHREDDIAEGYLIVRPEDGDSEHGSIYGRELLQFGGRVINPPPLSFADAMALRDLPYHQALARITSPTPHP